MDSFCSGECGYPLDWVASKELNEFLVEKGDSEAVGRKLISLAQGTWWGYERDPAATRELNESFVNRGDLEAIWRKIEGLACTYGYGYQRDPAAAQEFIESLLVSETPHVRGIGKYIKAFAQKYGISELGYEKDTEKAVEFIKQNHVPY